MSKRFITFMITINHNMPQLRLSEQDFLRYKEGFSKNPHPGVNRDLAQLIKRNHSYFVHELGGKSVVEIATLRKIPPELADRYFFYIVNHSAIKEWQPRLEEGLAKICSHPEIYLTNSLMWADIELCQSWAEFDDMQGGGYEVGDEDDDYEDLAEPRSISSLL